LWQAARPDTDDHAVDPPTLGEYAAILQLNGRRAADKAFPSVAQHLAMGCSTCDADLREMLAILAGERRQPPNNT
jgi:hypothetical protein